jgi:hypothetical protein
LTKNESSTPNSRIGATLGGRNEPTSDDAGSEQSAERLSSLMDVDEDEDESASTVPGTTSDPMSLMNSNETLSPPSRRKLNEHSNQIFLPDDYDRLEIPKLRTVNFEKIIREQLNLSSDADISEILTNNLVYQIREKSPPLEIQLDIKVRSIRDIDELNEVIFAYFYQ